MDSAAEGLRRDGQKEFSVFGSGRGGIYGGGDGTHSEWVHWLVVHRVAPPLLHPLVFGGPANNQQQRHSAFGLLFGPTRQ